MKVLPFKIPKPEGGSLVFQEDHTPVFYDKYHEHEEIQISIILKGRGTLIAGDAVNYFNEGDIIVIGSNLPHVFKSDRVPGKKSHMLSLFFTRAAFGEGFFELEELHELSSFFTKADTGFKVSFNSHLRGLFMQLETGTKLGRFMILLEILKTLSKASSSPLSSFNYKKTYSAMEGKRMQDIMEYTTNNYTRSISLDDIAEVAAMTKQAFCKYFKKRTRKTYIQFLNELRIENACKLLRSNTDRSITEIAERSGFNNISNFNRQFKSIKQMTPSKYMT
jgi:AraC-like DNA-binding protein